MIDPAAATRERSIKSGFQRAKRRLIAKGLIVSPKGSLYVWLAPDDGNLSDAPDGSAMLPARQGW
jgi:hypothetical protein